MPRQIKFFLFIILLVLVFIFRVTQEDYREQGRVIIKNMTLYVEIARKTRDLKRGLSNQDILAEDQGMLFAFPKKDYWVFWMKEMKFPIDIIWISDDKIVYLEKNVPILSSGKRAIFYSPPKPANYVLEVSAGLCDKYGWQVGDTVKIFDKK